MPCAILPLGLDVEKLSCNPGASTRREVIIANHYIAVVDKDGYRDDALIHDTPLFRCELDMVDEDGHDLQRRHDQQSFYQLILRSWLQK